MKALQPANYDAERWRRELSGGWDGYHAKAQSIKGSSKLVTLTASVLAPLATADGIRPTTLMSALGSVPGTEPLVKSLRKSASRRKVPYTLKALSELIVRKAQKDEEIRRSLEIIFLRTAALLNLDPKSAAARGFADALLSDLWSHVESPSALRLMSERIAAGENIAIAGGNATIIVTKNPTEKHALLLYLSGLRAKWNQPELSRVLPTHDPASGSGVRLHNLYMPMDVWRADKDHDLPEKQAMERRFRAIEKDMPEYRRPVLEVIAGQPHLVLTGDAGTGKSSLARYVAIALAYACDPSAEKHDKVHGIDLLGLSWYHGPLLPLYVSLKDFAADSAFPRNKTSAGAEHLLKYLRKQTSTLQNFLSDYLTRPAAPNQPYHTLLILDGLDEIYETAHRLRLQNVIENWADRFPTCRILMTSRTYAYRPRDRWRLSPRFATAELAPFTRSQMRDYITNWYRTAARTRPSSFGGEARAARVTDSLTANMVGQIDRNERLLPMMRQPLLLALLTLIHESRKHLPSRRAELYQSAIDLLFQWRPIALDERFAATLASINEERLLAALKLAAFHVQVKQPTYQKFPGALERATLKRYLTLQDEQAGGIGCEVNNLLDYFGAQNGILLPALTDAFRFPHLSIQEFLAASALIEFYDEIEMPVERPPSGHWDFPQNLMALIKDDPYRWRQVALMVGSIMANNIGQDGRWNLIEELLPDEKPSILDEAYVFRAYIAAEVYAMDFLKARQDSQDVIYQKLCSALTRIADSNHLDQPEKQRLQQIQRQMTCND